MCYIIKRNRQSSIKREIDTNSCETNTTGFTIITTNINKVNHKELED